MREDLFNELCESIKQAGEIAKMTELETRAWNLYCKETAGSMDVRDFWEELSPRIKDIFLAKAITTGSE